MNSISSRGVVKILWVGGEMYFLFLGILCVLVIFCVILVLGSILLILGFVFWLSLSEIIFIWLFDVVLVNFVGLKSLFLVWVLK